MRKKINEIINDVICEAGSISSVKVLEYERDGDRINIVCKVDSIEPSFDLELDDIDYYVNVYFEGDSLMIIQGVLFDDTPKNNVISESCKEFYKYFKKNIIDEISSGFENGSISPNDYDVLRDLCEEIKRHLWSIKELI